MGFDFVTIARQFAGVICGAVAAKDGQYAGQAVSTKHIKNKV